MRHLVKGELLKLRTARIFWCNVTAALAFTPVGVALAVTSGTKPLDSGGGVRYAMSAGASGAVMLLVIGILMMAGEFRHGTATSTFLVTPDRLRVVVAKLITASIVGACIATVASALTVAIAVPWLRSDGVSVMEYRSDAALALIGGVVATVLGAVVGVGLGALIRNQTAAITIALVWTQVVEGLLVGFVPEVGRWLPGGAASALAGVATANGGLLPMGAAAMLLTGYGLVFATAGAAAIVRRDIA